jgi:crotonobetainyl-CoA:carnitine CoA-transferase CaiB-like acyl-CoA transferase
MAPALKHMSTGLPLSAIKILDLSRVLAGPLCTMMLGDLGADVIKVERPIVGDDTRRWGGPLDSRGRSAYFLSINRNKVSVAADLGAPADRDLVLSLIAGADVVVDNFLPGALASRGIDPDLLVSQHPRLVWCTITGFGPNDPRPGYDFVTQAESGWMAITGEPDGDPMKVGVALADVIAGKDAAVAILAALLARDRGVASDRRPIISLMASARAALVNVAQSAVMSGENGERWGNAHPTIVPYQLFHAADQPIVVAVGSDAQWLACTRILGLDDLAADPALRANPGRLASRKLIVESIERVVREKPAAHWLGLLSAAGVPSGTVKPVVESVTASGASPVMGMPSSVGGTARREPPGLDEHGEVIRKYGWRFFDL